MDVANAIAPATSRTYSSASIDTALALSSPSDASASAASNKRKRSAHGCVVAENDLIVEELQKIRGKVRESSHLAGNYGRAIFSLQNHTEPITSAHEAKQLRNIGNYIANQIHSILQKHQLSSNGRSATTTTAAAPVVAAPVERPAIRAPVARETGQSQSVVVARREYVPAQGKQPWYVLRALKEKDATSEPNAVAVTALLVSLQSTGYEGNLSKLRICITSLVNTHKTVSKSSDGRVYLNERGVRSASLCTPTQPPPVPASVGGIEQERIVNKPVISSRIEARSAVQSTAIQTTVRPSKTHQPSSTGKQLTSVRTKTTVCIDLSDSEEDGFDSDAETIRATSSPTDGRDFEIGAIEPEEEPQLLQSQRQNESIFNIDAGQLEDFIREGDEWEVALILDHREVLSRRNRDILERKLLEVNVTCEVRSLNVGDVQWVARRYRGFESVKEFMLNVIVERKEVRDLSGSIIDRRYNEQKTRLRDSGMTHVIYLVEGSLTQQTTVRASGLQTALCRTQIQNQFFVQHCQNADESVAFLRGVHMSLLAKLPSSFKCRNRERISAGSVLWAPRSSVNDWKRQLCQPVRTYSDFNDQFRKKADFTVGEIYQMMLMQVHGLSSSRTAALSTRYPTFQHLAQAIERGDKIQDVRYGESQRRFGAKTAEFTKYLFQSTDYEKDTPSTGSGGVDES